MQIRGWALVGERIDRERIRRGHRTLVGFARAAGVGTSTLDNLIHARKTSYDPITLAAVERALGWQAGSIARIQQGLEPIDDHDPDLTTLLEVWPHLPASMKRTLRMLAVESIKTNV